MISDSMVSSNLRCSWARRSTSWTTTYVSPLRYAADGIGKSVSGQGDVWTELAVLGAFAAVTMSLGLWRLPWREE